ncbi:Protein MOR1 [Camellia lanceoleosa]|uniref:Protein MOR1 n=1 Tax=Camellia lanceoleosa TaxID=1840588 RepID=A0ACC0HWL8_9ERIC|nr:Protein MOR1 [Camellia lanceoleosa]
MSHAGSGVLISPSEVVGQANRRPDQGRGRRTEVGGELTKPGSSAWSRLHSTIANPLDFRPLASAHHCLESTSCAIVLVIARSLLFPDSFLLVQALLEYERQKSQSGELQLAVAALPEPLSVENEVPYITTALMDAKLGTEGRKDLFDWLSRQLSGLSNFRCQI